MTLCTKDTNGMTGAWRKKRQSQFNSLPSYSLDADDGGIVALWHRLDQEVHSTQEGKVHPLHLLVCTFLLSLDI